MHLGVCYELPNTATAGADTNHSIILLQRAGASPATPNNWPMVRKSANTVLESNTKEFVITRMATTQITSIVFPQEGMMVYINKAGAKRLAVFNGSKWSFWKP